MCTLIPAVRSGSVLVEENLPSRAATTNCHTWMVKTTEIYSVTVLEAEVQN
jgi:hypothetical protein